MPTLLALSQTSDGLEIEERFHIDQELEAFLIYGVSSHFTGPLGYPYGLLNSLASDIFCVRGSISPDAIGLLLR